MGEVFYNNNQIIIMNFSNRLASGGTLNEHEALMYEQACRLHETVSRALRMSTWEPGVDKVQKERDEEDRR